MACTSRLPDTSVPGGAPSSALRSAGDCLSQSKSVPASGIAKRIAYLVNIYPKVSHSFIRREITALEQMGFSVMRVSVRGWDEKLVDPADFRERQVTRYILKMGMWQLVMAALRVAYASPGRFAEALRLVFKLGFNADRSLPFHFIYLIEACQLALWLKAEGVEHLHAHFGTNPSEVALLAHVLSGTPFSFTVHGPDEFDRALVLHFDTKLPFAKFVVAVNSYCRSQLMRRTPHDQWHKIKVVHCGLDRSFFEEANAAPQAGSQTFLCVGRLCEQKGQLMLLESFARIAARFPQARVVLAGDGDMRPALEESIRRHGLGGRVTITGWITEAQVREEMLRARALVLPSFAESLPVVIMEAMALRRPVITTYVAGIPELVRDGETGWLIPAGSIEALSKAMTDCLERDERDLHRLGENGFARVSERHRLDLEALRLGSYITGKPCVEGIGEWA